MPALTRHTGPVLLVAVLVAAVGWWVFWKYFDTYHLAVVKPGILYRDGVRSLRQFELASSKAHFKTVVSLVDDNEIQKSPFTDELAYCQANGIQVVRLPIDLGGWPSGDQIKQFLQIVNDPSRQPVLVHCAQGVRRTGMMVAAYQRSVLQLDKDQTTAAMLTFGHSDRTVNDVKRFIDLYDPATQQMTASLPTSQE